MESIYTPNSESSLYHRYIEEASKNARIILNLYIFSLIYCLLTTGSITDKQLLIGEKVQLPIIGIQVSLLGYFFLSPLFLTIVFVVLQLYLQRIKSLKEILIPISHIKPLEIYPWIINIADDSDGGSVGRWQKNIVNLLLWWSLPFVLMMGYIWLLKKHDSAFSSVLIIETWIGFFLVGYFWFQYTRPPFPKAIIFYFWLTFWFFVPQFIVGSFWPKMFCPLAGMLWLSFIVSTFFHVILGFRIRFFSIYIFIIAVVLGSLPLEIFHRKTSLKYIATSQFSETSFDPRNLDLNFADLANPESRSISRRNSIVKPSAVFIEQNFRWAKMGYVVLESAYLTSTKFQHANLRLSNLDSTTMAGANFDSANLYKTGLNNSVAFETSFIKAKLDEAEMTSGNFSNSTFDKASLIKTDLYSAKLIGSSFQNSNLTHIYLVNCIADSSVFNGANLTDALMDSSSFVGASFIGANLENTFLTGSKFNGANFEKAIFKSVYAKGADFRGAKITIEQLDRILDLDETILDSLQLKLVRGKYPNFPFSALAHK